MSKYKQQFTRFKRMIVWLILATLVVCLGFWSIPSKKAKATVTNNPASDGTYTQWTPVGGGSHYTEVNDSSDSTYVYTTTTNNRDSYGLTSGQLPTGSNVTQIQVYARAHRNHPNKTATFKIFYRRGGADTDGATTHSMTNSWADYSQTWSSLSWNETDINNLQIGVLLVSAEAGTSPSVSKMWIVITYYAITSLTTDKGSYPTLGETITADSTVKNGSSGVLSGTTADYVIFIDGDADNTPDAGETYITNGCAGSASWSSGNYTRQWSVPNVAVEGTQSDQWTCSNSNFPQNTTYTLWMKWYSGATTYDTSYVTFTSVPTLGEILLVILLAFFLFLIVRLIFAFKKKRYWLFYYLMASISSTLAIIFFARHFGIDQFLVNLASFHVTLINQKLFHLPLNLLTNGRLQLIFTNGSSILKLGIECSAIIESSILASLLLFYPIFSLRQRILRLSFGLVITYVINILRLIIIVLMSYKLGSEYIYLAHAAVGRFFFFVFEILLFWFLFTKPIIKSIGDSIIKKVPAVQTARSGKSLQWRYTYGQAITIAIILVLVLISFQLSDDWKRIYQKETAFNPQEIMGVQINPEFKIINLKPEETKTYEIKIIKSGLASLKIIEGKEPVLVEIYLNGTLHHNIIVESVNNTPLIEKVVIRQIPLSKDEIIKFQLKNIGREQSSYDLEFTIE